MAETQPGPKREDVLKAFARLWADWAQRQAEKKRQDASASRLR